MAVTDGIAFTNYKGQQVRALDDQYRAQLDDAANVYNKSMGTNLTTEQYDRTINPNDAAARWGESDWKPAASTSTGATQSAPQAIPSPSTSSGGLLTPSKAVATGYQSINQNVGDKSLVQNQLAGITAKDSSLNQLAKTEAAKQASSRGLLNSSMAVGSAQRAVLQSALPIAQQDASTNAAADSANAQYANTAAQFNANAENAASIANAQLSTQQQLAQIQANTQMSIVDKQNATNMAIAQGNNDTQKFLSQLDIASKTGLAQLDADTKFKLANMDAQNKTALQTMINNNQQLLQSNVSASNIVTQYMTNLANISTSDKLDGPAKQQAIDNQTTALNEQLQVISKISGLDLSQYFVKA